MMIEEFEKLTGIYPSAEAYTMKLWLKLYKARQNKPQY